MEPSAASDTLRSPAIGAPVRRTRGTPRHGRPVRQPDGTLAARRRRVHEGGGTAPAYPPRPPPGSTLRPRSRRQAAAVSLLHLVLLGLMAAFITDTALRLPGASATSMVIYIALIAGTGFAFLLFAASLLIHAGPVLLGLCAPADPDEDPADGGAAAGASTNDSH